jgi:DNA-binding IclR family transcriptional regulator
VHVVHSRQPLQYIVTPGTLRPLARSGFGQLLLSGETDQVVRSTVRRLDAARLPGEEKIDVEALMRTIADIRQAGYAVSHSLVTPGVGIIGFLLPPTPFGRLFAIGLGGPSDRIEAGRERHRRLLQNAVTAFSATLN